jgi:hypothetical protein
LLAALIAVGGASAAPAQTPAEGTCYAARPLPALPSGTRVFARPALMLHRAAASTPATGAQPAPLRLEANLATMQRATNTWILTSGEPANQTAAPGDKGPFIVYDDRDGHTTTIRTAVSICAYPPGAPLPAYLAGVTPDLVIP